MYVCSAKMMGSCVHRRKGFICKHPEPSYCESTIPVNDPEKKVLVCNDETGDFELYTSLLYSLECVEAECNNSSWLSPDCFSVYKITTSGLVEFEFKFNEKKRYNIDLNNVE